MAANNNSNVAEILLEPSTAPYVGEDELEPVKGPAEVILQPLDLPTSVSIPLIGFAEPTAFVLAIALLTKILKG